MPIKTNDYRFANATNTELEVYVEGGTTRTMITESIIRAARRRIAAGGKRIELRDSDAVGELKSCRVRQFSMT